MTQKRFVFENFGAQISPLTVILILDGLIFAANNKVAG
jgi:hypothetical protein